MVAILLFLLAAVCLLFLFHCREAARLRRQLQDYNQGKSRGKLTNKSLFPGMAGLAREINRALCAGEDLREKAASQERRLRESIADLGHDLRTPLTVLQGYSELLQGHPERRTEYLHAFQEKCAQLTETVDQFTQWHQAQDTEMPLSPERFDLVDLLAACVIEQAGLFRQAGIEPEVELPEEPFFLISDQGKCRRILENLLTNARRYTTGSVRVELRVCAAGAELSVSNEAIGLTPQEVPQLFQRFYQRDPARSKSGSGLGLAIVQTLCQRLELELSAGVENGWLWVRIIF